MEILKTDVLVIGGGLAGLTAALQARESGLDVTLICRSVSGKSGNTLVSGASLSVCREESGQGDTPEHFSADILSSGEGINHLPLVEALVRQSGAALDILEDYGVRLRYVDGSLMVKQPGGHSAGRYYSADIRGLPYSNRGLSVMAPLRERASEAGVRLLDRTAALELITEQGAVYGAHCLDGATGKLTQLLAHSVVLSAGGGASLFERHNNTMDVACDSYRLAYEAGASLRDMEFVQFFPCMMFYPVRMSISSPLFGDGAVMKNALGEEFLKNYTPAGNRATRDVMARAVKMEIDAGRGNPEFVFVSCAGIDGQVLAAKYGELSAKLKKAGVDIRRDDIPVAPAAHFYIGGVCVDGQCQTQVPGLYACGEAAGGTHGANRLAGVALSEAVVTGRLAGAAAAKSASARKGESFPSQALRLSAGSGRWDAQDAIRQLRRSMWRDASLIRRREGLESLGKMLLQMEAEMEQGGRVSSPKEITDHYKAKSYLLTARMLTESALLRRESRGAHYRADYPAADDAFLGNYICKKDDYGRPRVSFVHL